MTPADDVLTLIQQAQAGSAEAAQALYDEHAPLLRHVIRQRLAYPLRRSYDSDDFLQAVWASFFRMENGERVFDSPQALMELLKRIAKNKVIDAYRHNVVTPEGHLDDPAAADRTDFLASAHPTPSHQAMAEETWNRILKTQPRLYRCVLEMLRRGYTHHEIADHLELNEKTIRRLLKRLLEKSSLPQ